MATFGRWDDQPLGARLGESWPLQAGQSVEDLLDRHQEGGRHLSEWEQEWLLNLIENQDHLSRICAGGAGADLMVPRIHQFMRARHRTPALPLEANEAVDLARNHLTRLGEFRDELVETDQLNEDGLEEFDSYVDDLRASQLYWVDSDSASAGFALFDGHTAVPTPGGSQGSTGATTELEEGAAEDYRILEMLSQHYWDNPRSRQDLGDGTYPWASVRRMLARLSDWTHQTLVEHVMAPTVSDAFDGEPFYRLWEGGGSMWIGADAIEVRTDWARRWPNSRYE